MSEHEQVSQLSALFDNELPPAEAELVIRRVLKDPSQRARWERYALIGACLRNEPVHAATKHPDVAERVRLQLADDATPAQEPGAGMGAVGRGKWAQFGRGALGGAIAASVAVLSLVAVRNMAPQATPALQLAAEPVVAPALVPASAPVGVTAPQVAPDNLVSVGRVAAADTPPPSYSTPVESSQGINTPLIDYVFKHSEVAAYAGRPLPLSAISGLDIPQGAVAIPDADIGASR